MFVSAQCYGVRIATNSTANFHQRYMTLERLVLRLCCLALSFVGGEPVHWFLRIYLVHQSPRPRLHGRLLPAKKTAGSVDLFSLTPSWKWNCFLFLCASPHVLRDVQLCSVQLWVQALEQDTKQLRFMCPVLCVVTFLTVFFFWKWNLVSIFFNLVYTRSDLAWLIGSSNRKVDVLKTKYVLIQTYAGKI